jgi:hypothetical protein
VGTGFSGSKDQALRTSIWTFTRTKLSLHHSRVSQGSGSLPLQPNKSSKEVWDAMIGSCFVKILNLLKLLTKVKCFLKIKS